MAELNEPLSDRELDVLALVVKGATNKEIAEALFISPNTVKVHLRNVYTKLGVSTRTEATVVAVEQNLITLAGEIAPDPPEPIDDDDPDEPATPPSPADDTTTAPAADLEPAARSRTTWIWPVIALLAVLVAALVILGQRLPGLGLSQPTVSVPVTPTPGRYDQIEDTRWFVSQEVNRPVAGGVLISSGTNLYQIGGRDDQGNLTGDAFLFDSLLRAWRPVTARPEPVRDAGGANLGGIIYVVGGRNQADEPLSAVYAYSPVDDQWRSVADLPRPLYGGVVVADGAFLYYLGGHDGQTAVNSAYVFDPTTNAWRPLPDLPQPQAFAAGGLIENAIYLVGGENESGRLTLCQKFEPSTELWDSCPPLNEPRSQSGSAVVLNKLYILGGSTTAHFGELLDPRSGKWQIINVPMLSAGNPADWAGPGVANIEAKIYLIGGRLASGEINQSTYVYAPLVYQSFIPATQAGGSPDDSNVDR